MNAATFQFTSAMGAVVTVFLPNAAAPHAAAQALQAAARQGQIAELEPESFIRANPSADIVASHRLGITHCAYTVSAGAVHMQPRADGQPVGSGELLPIGEFFDRYGAKESR